MNVPGHLAAAYFLARRGAALRLERLGAIALGALLPDLIDKPLMLAGATPYGRTVGHSLLLWCAALALWLLVRGRSSPASRSALASAGPALSLLAGGLSHLCVDLVDDVAEGFERTGYVFSAWMGWPVTNPDMAYVKVPHLLEPLRYAVTPLEVATVAACLWHALAHRYGRG